MSEQIIIFDTTLRDGEQALQSSLSTKKKLKIALSLEEMGIDIIEAGFPISSPGDFKSVEAISKKLKNSIICSLARCVQKDIDVAAEAMRFAKNFRIHIFLGTSPLHVKSKLKKSFSEIIDMAVFSIKQAKRYTNDIEFSCEDAGRTPINQLCYIVENVIKAGATTINIPDTVGCTIPHEFSQIIKSLYNKVPNIDKVVLSVHCHNDLGMATANSITAIQAGVRQIEGTMNGMGERAGNTALEEVIIAIKLKKNNLNLHTNIKHKKIYKTSKLISEICNTFIPSNKAIVGTNAFSHSSGIHQDGILKNRKNYEIITPESIGLKPIKLNLTSRSGRAAVKYHMIEMGYDEKLYNLDILYNSFLKLADKKGQVFDYELEALAFIDQKENDNEHFRLKKIDVQKQSIGITFSSIELYCGKKIKIAETKTKKGLINSIYITLNKIANFPIFLKNIQLITKKKKIHIEISTKVQIEYKKRQFYGIGNAKDIAESTALAIIHILNNIWRANKVNIILKNIKK
ncbi:2-isopropylmalate synthase [Buchnera aphidicola]|uniref:2-isopropylmalate synthase n=1 Tax=Buchnera aphidicola TaxID=9 RepID=UPI0034643392